MRGDERVTVIERANARALELAMLPYAPDLIVVDVSFISLTKVLPAVLACAAERFDCLAMVKPQFEVGRGRVGKGGVVHEPALRREAVASAPPRRGRAAPRCAGSLPPACPGPAGNRETFLWLGQGGRAEAPTSALAGVEV